MNQKITDKNEAQKELILTFSNEEKDDYWGTTDEKTLQEIDKMVDDSWEEMQKTSRDTMQPLISIDIKGQGYELDSGADAIKGRVSKDTEIDLEDKILTFSLGDEILYFHSREEVEKALDALTTEEKEDMLKNAKEGTVIDLQEDYAEKIINALPIKAEHKHLENKKQWFFEVVEKAEEILIGRDRMGTEEKLTNDESKNKRAKNNHKIKR